MRVDINGNPLEVEVLGDDATAPVMIVHHGAPGLGSRAEPRDRLPRITCPTLVTVGRHDWITPVAASEEIAGLIPGARLVVFEESGHSPQLEEPERFQRTVREFLASAGVLAVPSG